MTAWTRLCQKILTPAECQSIIADALENIPPQDGLIGHGGKSVKDEKMRESTVRWIRRDNPKYRTLFSKIDMNLSIANAETFGMRLEGVPYECQFTTYKGTAEGHYDWHEDNSWIGGPAIDRKLSMVILLADPETFEGGKLEVWGGNPTLGQGDAVIFPSFCKHRVTPVTSGVRYSLVSWWRGPRLA